VRQRCIAMKSPSNRELFAYWQERRGDRSAPARGDIEPGAIRRVLGDSFILSFDATVDHPFRLAGTRVCAIFGRELKGESFVRIWDEADRGHIHDLVAIVADEGTGIVAGAVATASEDRTTELELLLLPLLHEGPAHVRLLGALSPLKVPFWLGRSPVETLTLGALRHLDADSKAKPAPRLLRGAPSAGQGDTPPPGFMVYEGGRQ
jgi:hypothetical protein